MSEISVAQELAWTTVHASNAAFDYMEAVRNNTNRPQQAEELAKATRDFERLVALGAPAAALIAEGLYSDENADIRPGDQGQEPSSSSLSVVRVSGEVVVPTDGAAATADHLRRRLPMLFGGLATYKNISVDVRSLGESAQQSAELDRPISELLEEKLGPDPYSTARISNCFRREGIKNLRDMLVIGKTEIRAIRNLGKRCVDALQEILADVDPDLVWHNKPKVSDIAGLCSSLDQVTVLALRDKQTYYLRDMDMQTLASTDLDTLMEHIPLVPRYEGPKVVRHEQGQTRSEVALLQAAAQDFAATFIEARSRITADGR